MAVTKIHSAPREEIVSNIHFLSRDAKWNTIKPYTARYDPKGSFPHTNIDSIKYDVKISDMRPLLGNLKWEECGFQVTPIRTSMTYADYNVEDIVQETHLPEIQEAVKQTLGASKVYVMDYKIRKRDSTFPLATGERYQHRQPSSRAHLGIYLTANSAQWFNSNIAADFTHDAVCKIIKSQFVMEADELLQGQWQAINVWHPLRGPLVDWPLAVCDASTVDFEADTMPSDIVDPWGYIENTQVQYNLSQQWYYLKDQLPSELLIFKNADSRSNSGDVFPGTPHASFYNPSFKKGDFMRESIEIRTLVAF